MTASAQGNGTAVVCGVCGEHIERAIWAADIDVSMSFAMQDFIDTHARTRRHRVSSIHFEPMVLAWHEM